MNLFAQHGYGKTDKIEAGLAGDAIEGVILSPKDEKPEDLEKLVTELDRDFPKAQLLIDPQFYVSTTVPAKDGNLPLYPYYRGSLSRKDLLPARHLTKFARQTLDYQRRLPVDFLLSATVPFDDFTDPWCQTALSLAQESAEYAHKFPRQPLLLSLVIDETAFRHASSMKEFLDMVTLFDVAGFYVIVKRRDAYYSQQIETNILENMLYFTHVLGDLNDYKVVFGYTDLIGLPIQAAGAYATACGWYQSQRFFHSDKFKPIHGGRKPRPRYTSLPLMNSVLFVPELSAIQTKGKLERALSDTEIDHHLAEDFSEASTHWSLGVATLHHWSCIRRVLAKMKRGGNTSDRLDVIQTMISRAGALYDQLLESGITFEYRSGNSHLAQWNIGIENFRTTMRI
ncbi:hypothetical protein SCOR_19065 [Sulfidibacter corallicola]|uniref:Uncharacterized protein n=1 Tax=Sulfidibacter corallicola TaxID=2818388 RepID=A0A8A4TW95_SULCO|nr:hypothetical protein [Sulfidibacter corallicola]QTD53451.1 hypothetical protein J3U87_13435 [Sulfidibacter corallicola]